jgi:hypothetical protein
MRVLSRQIFILLIFSALVSVGAIIHGIYMDLDFSQIKRLTLEGILLTVLVIFPAILILEKIFDINNNVKLDELNKRISKLEGKKR